MYWSFHWLFYFKPPNRLPKKKKPKPKPTHSHGGADNSFFLFTMSSLPTARAPLKSPSQCCCASSMSRRDTSLKGKGEDLVAPTSLLSKYGASGQHHFRGTLAHPLFQ